MRSWRQITNTDKKSNDAFTKGQNQSFVRVSGSMILSALYFNVVNVNVKCPRWHDVAE